MRTIKACGLGLLLAGSVLVNAASAAEAAGADGQALYTAKACNTCHGPDAKKTLMPAYPKLAGQNEQYLYQQSMYIRDGQRAGGMTAAMKALVTNVTDDEFKAIAKWLAGLE